MLTPRARFILTGGETMSAGESDLVIDVVSVPLDDDVDSFVPAATPNAASDPTDAPDSPSTETGPYGNPSGPDGSPNLL
jgi:hypothetical protein